MISHANGDAAWHRQERGIKTPEQVRIEILQDRVESYQDHIEMLEAELAECKRDAYSIAQKAATICKEKCKNATGQRHKIDMYVSANQIAEDLVEAIDSAIAAQKGEGK